MTSVLRRSERLLIAYFLYVAIVGIWRSGTFPGPGAGALLFPLSIVAIARLDRVSGRRVFCLARDWLPAVLLLVAYWSVDWVAPPHGDYAFENSLVRRDRGLLDDGLRADIERFGAAGPAMLEVAFLAVYAVVPLTIAGFSLRHQRDRLDDFLFPFLLGTLSVYALMPHYPTVSPRNVFEGVDVPPVETVFRQINVWILDRWDIESSVMPSGHVAVVFSAAFAMWLAVPERRSIGWTLLVIAVLVWVSAVYGRYDYAAGGLAAVAVSAAAIGLWALGSRLWRSPKPEAPKP